MRSWKGCLLKTLNFNMIVLHLLLNLILLTIGGDGIVQNTLFSLFNSSYNYWKNLEKAKVMQKRKLKDQINLLLWHCQWCVLTDMCVYVFVTSHNHCIFKMYMYILN